MYAVGDYLKGILENISSVDFNILLLLGIALFGGTIGGRFFRLFGIPQVVGYIAIGVIIGQSGLKIVTTDIITALVPFSYFALGLIGFMIGGELKKSVFQKYGKQFTYILFSEVLVTFCTISLGVFVVGVFFLHDVRSTCAIALLLGAIGSASAPAATTDVLWEHKTRGPLTTTILGIIALDDALALILFAIATSISHKLLGTTGDENILHALLHPLYEVGGACIVGAFFGYCLSTLLREYREEDKILSFSVGMVLLVLGFSLLFHIDILIAAMSLGMIMTNLVPRKSKQIFTLVQGFSPPIYILFFVLIGARLDVLTVSWITLLIALAYLLARTIGKILGSRWGAILSHAPVSIQRYLPYCLFSQAGVAIGLSVFVAQRFPGLIGNITIIVLTLSTLVVQLIGPSFTLMAVQKAKEVGRNISEADLLSTTCVHDVLHGMPPMILETASLHDILNTFRTTSNLFYPVVDKNHHLRGIITVDHIKDIFMETALTDVLLAHDIMEPAVHTRTPETTLADINDLMAKYCLRYVPVVSTQGVLQGIIEPETITTFVATRLVELHKDIGEPQIA